MATLALHRLTKVYPNRAQPLTDVSLEVADGELLVLLGPSGCGKSTLLRLVAGLEQPSAGEILIDGCTVNDRPPQQRNVAMVFQNYALYPHMTVRANLEFPLRMRRLKRGEIRSRVAAVARSLDIEALLEQHPRQLSGGQRQRVAMGRALVRDPAVFLMDEPLSNLDAGLRAQIRSEIAALQRRTGTTTLYVTHDQVEAMTLGQRVAVLHQGRLQQVGAPQEIYQRPANAFVAGFLGSPAMNLFRARVARTADGLTLELEGTLLPLPGNAAGQRLAIGEEGEQVLAGIRPEGFAWPDQRPELPAACIEVTAVESLGHEQLVYFSLPRTSERAGSLAVGAPLIARLPGTREIEPGAALRLAVDTGRIHWFDSAGGALPN